MAEHPPNSGLSVQAQNGSVQTPVPGSHSLLCVGNEVNGEGGALPLTGPGSSVALSLSVESTDYVLSLRLGLPEGGAASPLRLRFCDGKTASPLLLPQPHLSLEPSFLPYPSTELVPSEVFTRPNSRLFANKEQICVSAGRC